MLKTINLIFNFLGLNKINLDNFSDMNVIFNNFEDLNKMNDKLNKCKIFYRVIITLILLVKPIYFLYEIITNNIRDFYPTFLFSTNIFVNYIILLKYFKNNYFENIIYDYFSLENKIEKLKLLLNDYFMPILIIFFFYYFYNK